MCASLAVTWSLLTGRVTQFGCVSLSGGSTVSWYTKTLAISVRQRGVSRSANRILTVLPRSAPEIARQSLPAKFRFPDHKMERPKRGLRSEDDKEDSRRAERIGMDQPSSART